MNFMWGWDIFTTEHALDKYLHLANICVTFCQIDGFLKIPNLILMKFIALLQGNIVF